MMKLVFIILILLLNADLVYSQVDTGQPIPPAPRRAGKTYNHNDMAREVAMEADHKMLIADLSQRWKSCGGDNSGMTDLLAVATNLLVVYEAHQKAGMQPECEECQKKASRYECMANDDGFTKLRLFIAQEDVIELLMIDYGISKLKTKKLISSLKKICHDSKE